MTTFTTCSHCTPAIVNDDTSGLTEEATAKVTEFCKDAGFLAFDGETTEGGYCDCCGDPIYGEAFAFETVA